MSTVTFRCSSCNQALRASADKVGKKVKCTKCGEIMVIPESGDTPQGIKPAAAAPPPVPARRPPADEDADDERPRRKPRPVEDDEADEDMPRSRKRRPIEDDDEDDRPRRRALHDDEDEEDDEDDRPLRRKRVVGSGAVTLVGVLDLSYAALITIFSIAVMIAGPTLLATVLGMVEDAAAAQARMQPNNPRAQQALQQGKQAASGVFVLGTVMCILVGTCAIVIGGVPLLLAGLGVLQRRNWGRILTLVLGVLSLLGAINQITHGVPPNIYAWTAFLIQLGFGVTVVTILFIPRYAAEFHAIGESGDL